MSGHQVAPENEPQLCRRVVERNVARQRTVVAVPRRAAHHERELAGTVLYMHTASVGRLHERAGSLRIDGKCGKCPHLRCYVGDGHARLGDVGIRPVLVGQVHCDDCAERAIGVDVRQLAIRGHQVGRRVGGRLPVAPVDRIDLARLGRHTHRQRVGRTLRNAASGSFRTGSKAIRRLDHAPEMTPLFWNAQVPTTPVSYWLSESKAVIVSNRTLADSRASV